MSNTHDPSSFGWRTALAIYAALTAAYCWPLLLAMGSVLPNDTGDPGLLSFVLWWNAKTVPFTDAWWNAPMFYPVTGALAFSDTLLGMSPFTTPLIWAGFSPVAAHNALFVVSIFSAAVAAHALGHYLTGRHDTALIAGLAFGFSPYRASQMPHLQLLVTCWMALGLYSLHRYLDRRRWSELAIFGVSWLVNALISGYYMVFFAVLLGLWMLWFARRISDWVAVAVTGVLSSLPLLPMLIGHQRIQRFYGMARGRDEIESFSADLSGFFSAPWHTWLPRHYTLEPRAEGELYPGIAIVALTLAGAVAAFRYWKRGDPIKARPWLAALAAVAFGLAALSGWTGGWQFSLAGIPVSLTRPHRIVTAGIWLAVIAAFCDRRWIDAWRRRSPLAFYGLSAVVMAGLALGPVGRVFGYRFMLTAPYAWLMEFPGGDSLRVPARFAMLMALCLAVSAALALARLTPKGVKTGVLVLLSFGVLVEGWVPKMLVAKTPPLIELPGLDPKTAVLEVPSRDLWTDTAAMLRVTKHGYPTINGFSGYGPPHHYLLFLGLQAGDSSVVETWREFGPVAVIVIADDDTSHAHEEFISKIPDAMLTYRTSLGPVYRFPAKPRRSDAGTVQLPIAGITANRDEQSIFALTDGKLETQWKSLRPQSPGDSMTISLGRERRVDRLVLDLGESRLDFPRHLRIEARQADGFTRVVWDSGTAGPAAAGVIEDRLTVPVTLRLPEGTRAESLVLTLTGEDPDYYWTVAELRVYGE